MRWKGDCPGIAAHGSSGSVVELVVAATEVVVDEPSGAVVLVDAGTEVVGVFDDVVVVGPACEVVVGPDVVEVDLDVELLVAPVVDVVEAEVVLVVDGSVVPPTTVVVVVEVEVVVVVGLVVTAKTATASEERAVV